MMNNLLSLVREERYEELCRCLPLPATDPEQALSDIAAALAELRVRRTHLLGELRELEALSAYAVSRPELSGGFVG